jgi:hypothetical protein
VHEHPRLVDIRLHDGVDEIWAALARHGRPIQYSHIQEPLAMWDTWTSIASQPVAFEAPSAGFILDWSTLRALRARHASIASITHAAGISSTGDPDLDRILPLDEPYDIPPATAALVNRTKERGGRVLAIGTTVVRALEHAACGMGRVRSGGGVATQRIGAQTELGIVDGIVSGIHEPGTSHYELLRAFREDDALEGMAAEAERHDYRAHEFGDALLIERSAPVATDSVGLERDLGNQTPEQCIHRASPLAATRGSVARTTLTTPDRSRLDRSVRESRCLSSTRREQRLRPAEAVEAKGYAHSTTLAPRSTGVTRARAERSPSPPG